MLNTFIPANLLNKGESVCKEQVFGGLVKDLDEYVRFIPREYFYNGEMFEPSSSPFGRVRDEDLEIGYQAKNSKTLIQYLIPSFNSDGDIRPNYATFMNFTCPVGSSGSPWVSYSKRNDEERNAYSYPMWLILMWAFHVYCSIKKRSMCETTTSSLKELFEESKNDYNGITDLQVDEMMENLVTVFFLRCNGNCAMPDKVRGSVISEGFKKFVHSGFTLNDLTQNEQNHRNALIKVYERLAVSIMPSLNYDSEDINCTDVIKDFCDIVAGIYGYYPDASDNVSRNREISFKQKYALWGAWA